MVRPGSVAFILLLAIAARAQAPGGYKTYENKSAEVTFYYPTVYAEVPLPPTEQTLVARFVSKDVPPELKKADPRAYKSVEPQFYIYLFEKPAAVTGAKPDQPADGSKEKEGPSTVREAMEEGSRVTSWEEFEKRFKRSWRLEADPKDDGWYTLVFTGDWGGGNDCKPVGRVYRHEEGGTTYGLYGYTLTPHEKTFAGQMAKVAKGLALADPTANERAGEAIDKIYASGTYSAVDLRKAARQALARGWKAYDTENYLIVHHSKNEALIKRIGRDIEAMRLLYIELFPPVQPMDKLSIVRVCRTKEEYSQYGGPPNTGGYWHPGNEELVFYDYSYTMKQMDDDQRKAMGNRKLTDDDSLLVLYHEAFHQHVYYAVGEFAPHDWFNEGFGDYFSGADIGKTTGKLAKIDPSPWRIHMVKDQCEYGEGFIPLKDVLEAERAVFYNPARARFFYAEAWSFVYFLKTSKEAAANEKWSKILQTYYDTAKTAYAEELKKFGEKPDMREKQIAQFGARKTALKACLDGINIKEMETAWKKYVIEMKDPWPSLRKKHK